MITDLTKLPVIDSTIVRHIKDHSNSMLPVEQRTITDDQVKVVLESYFDEIVEIMFRKG